MNSPTLQETRELELPVSPGSHFSIEAGSGPLLLQGEAGADAIHVTAEIYQIKPHDDYVLMLDSDDGTGARLVSKMNANYADANDWIALSIRVPASLQVGIVDSSGSMEITGLTGDLEIEGGSGSLLVRDIDADVAIDDESGSLRVENTGGNLRIEDGSGSITVRNTAGNVHIRDESGSITVTETGGTVTIRDGSGSISVDGAADFELLEDGSGSVEVDNIRNRAAQDD